MPFYGLLINRNNSNKWTFVHLSPSSLFWIYHEETNISRLAWQFCYRCHHFRVAIIMAQTTFAFVDTSLMLLCWYLIVVTLVDLCYWILYHIIVGTLFTNAIPRSTVLCWFSLPSWMKHFLYADHHLIITLLLIVKYFDPWSTIIWLSV